MTMPPKEIAAAVALFGGALITIATIGYAIYKAAAGAFGFAVEQHVAPLFSELKVSLSTLNATMASVKADHDAHSYRVDTRLDSHDEDIGLLAQRQARIEGKIG